jgi:flagellar biosynthesis GTPase FlhF
MTRELNTRREQAVKAVDDALKQIQAENASLVDKIKNAIKALIDALGRFLVLMAKITRMGIGTFISEAASQALDGIRNNLWDELKLAFNEWIESKFAFIQMLLNIPSNIIEMLTQLATTFFSTFIDNLPEMMPAIAVAAMAWLATQLALKLIPGAGAIMAVIDGIRAAWGFVQNFLAAASAFYDFVVIVASRGNGAVQFAKALARGIIAALEALLTFLGVDALIRRVAGAILKPIGKIFSRLGERFKKMIGGRRKGGEHDASDHHKRSRGPQHEQPPDPHAHKNARQKAEHDEHMENRRHHDKDKRRQEHEKHSDKRKHDNKDPNAAHAHEHEKERMRDKDEDNKKQERLDRAVTAIRPKADNLLAKGVSGLRLRMHLALWRVTHRLSSLRMVGNQIEAAVNPKTIVIVSDKMSPAEIGAALEPVLQAAEAQYFALRNAEHSRASAHRVAGAEHALHNQADANLPFLHRHEEVQLLRGVRGKQLTTAERGSHQSTKVTGGAVRGTHPEADARMFLNADEAGQASLSSAFIPSAGHYESEDGGAIIADHVTDVASRVPLSEVPANLSQTRQRLIRTLEPARREGVFATMSIGEQMANRGLVSHAEAMAGESAPMAFKGATSGTPAATTEIHRRTGNLFGHLREAISRQDLYSKPGGAALRKLAIHVEHFLAAHLKAQAQGEEVSPSAIRRLTLQLIATLRFFEG